MPPVLLFRPTVKYIELMILWRDALFKVACVDPGFRKVKMMVPPADCCTPLMSNGVGSTNLSIESQDNDENDAEYDEFLRFVYFDKLQDDTNAALLYATQKKNHGPTAYEVSSPNEDEAGSDRNNSSYITLATLDTIPEETKTVYNKQQEYYTENEFESTMMTTSTTTTGGSSIEIINDTKDNNDSNNISINNNNNNDDWMRKCIHIAIEYYKNTFTILTENINLYIINIDTWYNAVKHNTDISYNIQSTYQTIMFHVELFILSILTSFGYLIVFFFATFISSESDDTSSSSITRSNTANIKKEDQVEDNTLQNIIEIADPTTDTTTNADAIKSRDDNTDAAPDSTPKENHKREKENNVVALPTPEQLKLVQTSWAKVVPIADVAADLFYNKLFELDPALRPLFPDKMVYQKSKLMKMLDLAVDGLTNLEELVPKVQNLGRRHAHYFDATPPMYATVGAALLDTLKKGLGDSWDEAHEEAWTVVYGVLSSTMIDAGERLSKSSYSSLSIIREDIGIDTIPHPDDRGDKKKMQMRISITEKYIRTTPPIDFRTEQIQKIKSLTAALFEDKTTVNDEKKSMDENYWVGI